MDVQNGISALKKFVVDNNIIGTTAGVCVALAAKDGIQSLVGDIIIPAIILFLHALHIDFLTQYLPIKGSSHLKVGEFIKQMVTFFLIIIISFIFVKFAFGFLLGLKYTKSDPSAPATTAPAVNPITGTPTTNPMTGSNPMTGTTTSNPSTVAASSSKTKEKFANLSDLFSGSSLF